MPPAGRVGDREIVVPALERIVSFQGDAKAGSTVTNVRLSGLVLTECRQEAVFMTGATRCEVTACELRNVGTAVYLGDDTHRCRVAGRWLVTRPGSRPGTRWAIGPRAGGRRG